MMHLDSFGEHLFILNIIWWKNSQKTVISMFQNCFYVPPSLRSKAAIARTPPSGKSANPGLYFLLFDIMRLNTQTMSCCSWNKGSFGTELW